MTVPSHLRALQALDMAIRKGSLKDAADHLGITPAAVGLRIRSLENYLGTDLLVRGRSGLQPTKELDAAMADLRLAFDALARVSETLDFQRVAEIHIVADIDWAELWLEPRLPGFRDKYPNIHFCINGAGDVPTRLGAPDLRIEYGRDASGEAIFVDQLLPVCSPDNVRRIADYDQINEMEGMPLLHLAAQRDDDDCPGWRAWFDHFGLRASGGERGVHYGNARLALEAARQDVGFLICGYALAENDLKSDALVLPYPLDHSLAAPFAYRMRMRDGLLARPQMSRFVAWLQDQARQTSESIEAKFRRPALRPELPR